MLFFYLHIISYTIWGSIIVINGEISIIKDREYIKDIKDNTKYLKNIDVKTLDDNKFISYLEVN